MLKIPLFVREGTILVEQEPEVTTTAQAMNDMKLIIFYQDQINDWIIYILSSSIHR